jgi:hypothetical protein
LSWCHVAPRRHDEEIVIIQAQSRWRNPSPRLIGCLMHGHVQLYEDFEVMDEMHL